MKDERTEITKSSTYSTLTTTFPTWPALALI